MRQNHANRQRLNVPPSGYRLHRFPPLAQPLQSAQDELSLGMGWQDSQAERQQQLEAGFAQGLDQGHQEGLRQGVEQGKQQGLLEGQKEGFQQGFVSGEQTGRQEFQAAAQPVNELYQALSRWQSEREQQQRHMICELVQKVAQQVIRAELTLMPQQILTLVDETLESLPGKSEKVTVHLNPQDLERITHINRELPAHWKLVANNTLPIGGVHLVTEDAEADASCDSRLQACMDNVKQHLLEETVPEVAELEESAFEPQQVSEDAVNSDPAHDEVAHG